MLKTATYKQVYLYLIIVYLVALPLNAIQIGSFGSAVKILAVLPICMAFLSRNNIRVTKSLKWQFIFTLFMFLSIIWSSEPFISLSRSISYILLFVLLLSASMFEFNVNELKKVKSSLVWASRITAVLLLVLGDVVGGRLWLKGIITEDPNYICAYFAFGTIFALNKIISEKKIFAQTCGAIELFLYVCIVFLTGSRGGLISILSAIGIYVITFSRSGKKYIVAKIITFAFVFVIINVILDNLPQELRIRFSFDNVSDSGGSGRTDLWKNAIDMFLNANIFTKIFGYGAGTVRYNMDLLGYPNANVVHNIFLEMLVELGIVGLIIYSVAIFLFAKKAFQNEDKFAFSVIVCMIVLSLSTSIYAFKPYFNIMLYIVMLKNKSIKGEYAADRRTYSEKYIQQNGLAKIVENQ